jgi:hypothetical protein
MENFLINYLLKNCVTLAKEFFSSEKVTGQEGDNALNFMTLLDTRMESGIATPSTGTATSNAGTATPNTGIVDGTVSKEKEDETSEENSTKEDDLTKSPLNFLDTQSILVLLQTYLQTQDRQDNTVNALQNNRQSLTIEEFLQNVFSLLQEGETVQFLKEKSMGAIPLVQTSKEEETAVEKDQNPIVGPGKAMDNSALVGYLASILRQFNASERTDENVENTGSADKDVKMNEYGKPQGVEVLKTSGMAVASEETVKVSDETAKPSLNKTEMPIISENENKENKKDVLTPPPATVKPFSNIEVKKLNDRENVIQIISNESSSRESKEVNKNISVLAARAEKPSFSRDNNLPEFISSQSLSGQSEEVNKNISVLTAKTEKVVLSRDDDVAGIVPKVSDKADNEYAGLDERRLLSQNGYTKTSVPLDKETGKVLEKTPFASVMTDRIEKIVEQYANKNVSMDMVVRLKIDEKETLFVGLKEQGQRVIVEVKTTNESMGTFLQSQKEEIARQLEGKHIHANIYVDLQNENREKREQRGSKQKKRSNEQDKQDFVGFIEAMA